MCKFLRTFRYIAILRADIHVVHTQVLRYADCERPAETPGHDEIFDYYGREKISGYNGIVCRDRGELRGGGLALHARPLREPRRLAGSNFKVALMFKSHEVGGGGVKFLV